VPLSLSAPEKPKQSEPQTFENQPNKMKAQHISALPGSKEVVSFLGLLKETKRISPKTIISLYYANKLRIQISAKWKRTKLNNTKKTK
jgi:hypothetical protein